MAESDDSASAQVCEYPIAGLATIICVFQLLKLEYKLSNWKTHIMVAKPAIIDHDLQTWLNV